MFNLAYVYQPWIEELPSGYLCIKVILMMTMTQHNKGIITKFTVFAMPSRFEELNIAQGDPRVILCLERISSPTFSSCLLLSKDSPLY